MGLYSFFFVHAFLIGNQLELLTVVRCGMDGLLMPHLLFFFGFSSTNSFTGGVEAVLVNYLAKWLPCESIFLGAWRRSREKPLFWLHPSQNHCERWRSPAKQDLNINTHKPFV
jgi:hypothetical protein